MATIKEQPVLGDLGSHEVQLLLTSYNNLLSAMGDLITGLKTAVDIIAVNTLATTAETAIQNNVFFISSKPSIPPYRHFPQK